ncbi:Uncharacterised protein [Candidatus Tiddalikarchaeum anstoanum]|nr:Uncharacterised protein [Candidatus Tiddalikarchaeum anstoanum]
MCIIMSHTGEILEHIQYESVIKLENIPLQWISRFETFYPDLPQYPITYINITESGERVYGFIVSFSFNVKSDKLCDVDALIVTNKDINSNETLKKIVKKEVAERIGLGDKVSLNDILSCCNGNKKYEDFFKELWKYISQIFGNEIPYGKFYEEIYSMVRFVSAWQPKTGRQSEMRMLYNFLSIFGEKIEIIGKWNFLEFFLLPTYQDVKNKNFNLFPNFKMLYQAMEKIWGIYFTQKYSLDNMEIHFMKRSWPQDKDTFITKITYPLYKKGEISADEKQAIDRLVDAFNRHSWRAAFFIWSIMSIQDKDFYSWDKEFFVKFYLEKNLGVGISPKVVACFLQQGFKNEDIIPIDTWVDAFYNLALGIATKKEFFSSFSKMGKLERAIWLSSQARKTNIKTFFDLMWCVRYGDTGNNRLRGPNPISCYECKLRGKCPSYFKISEENVLLLDKSGVKLIELKTKEGNVKGEIIDSKDIFEKAKKDNCYFICLTEDKIPKKVFVYIGKFWTLTDEFSGYILNTQKVCKTNITIKVKDMLASLPELFK